jgi:2-dehydropantoate 2-reductase
MPPLPFDPLTARIAVIGAGAVGSYYGGRLALHGHDVHFLLRSDFEAVSRNGLRVQSITGDFHLPQPQIHRDTTDIGPCDLVIIALKNTHNPQLTTLIPPLLKPGTILLTLQNGLGNEAFLSTTFPGHDVLGGLCFVCINRTSPGCILHIAQGQITMGDHERAALPHTHALAAAFNAAGIPCNVDDSLTRARWKKLVWNIPFNGLSIAAGRLDTAALLTSEALTTLIRDLMHEVIATANHLGHELSLTLADEMIARTRTITPYKPSSLIDFEAGHEVELDAIWSEPARQARASGHPMPRVEMLAHLLRSALEQRRISL